MNAEYEYEPEVEGSSWLAVLFTLQLIAAPYTIKLFEFLGVVSLGLAGLTFPFVYRYMRWKTIWALVQIFAVASLATVIAYVRYPSAGMEYLKSMLAFLLSLGTGYIGLLTVLHIPGRVIARICACVAILFLSFTALEVSLPQVHSLSMRLSVMQGNDEKQLEDHLARDVRVHAGRVRPLAGTQEPSRVATLLAACLAGYGALGTKTLRGVVLAFALLAGTLFVTRSPTVVVIVAGVVVAESLTRNKVTSFTSLLYLVIIPAVLVLLAQFVLAERLQLMSEGGDGSFKERVLVPFYFLIAALRDSWGMGIGYLGAVSEPGNRSLDPFLPMLVEALRNAEFETFLRRDVRISVAHNAFCTFWFYNGIPLGIVSVKLWFDFANSIEEEMGMPLICLFLFLGTAIGGYGLILFWQTLLFAFGFLCLRKQEARQMAF